MRILWTASKWTFIGLLILLIIMVAAMTLLPDFHQQPDVGCYWTADNVWYVMCRGFPGAKLVSLLLTLPHIVFFYAPILLWGEVTTGSLGEIMTKAPPLLLLQVIFVCWLALGLAYPILWLGARVRRPPTADKPSAHAYKGKSL